VIGRFPAARQNGAELAGFRARAQSLPNAINLWVTGGCADNMSSTSELPPLTERKHVIACHRHH
jgi:hypothetical protein